MLLALMLRVTSYAYQQETAIAWWFCCYMFCYYRVGQKTGPLCSSEILLRSARFFAEIKVV